MASKQGSLTVASTLATLTLFLSALFAWRERAARAGG